MRKTKAVRDLFARQHGLATRAQLRKLGVHSTTIARGLKVGSLRPIHHGVYVLTTHRSTPEQGVLAGVLAVGGDAVASHGTAAWVHGLKDFREPKIVEVITS